MQYQWLYISDKNLFMAYTNNWINQFSCLKTFIKLKLLVKYKVCWERNETDAVKNVLQLVGWLVLWHNNNWWVI